MKTKHHILMPMLAAVLLTFMGCDREQNSNLSETEVVAKSDVAAQPENSGTFNPDEDKAVSFGLLPDCPLEPGTFAWFSNGSGRAVLTAAAGVTKVLSDSFLASAISSYGGAFLGQTLPEAAFVQLGGTAATVGTASVVCRAGLWGVIAVETAIALYLTVQLGNETINIINAKRVGMDLDAKLCNITTKNFVSSALSCPLPSPGSTTNPCLTAAESNLRSLVAPGSPCMESTGVVVPIMIPMPAVIPNF